MTRRPKKKAASEPGPGSGVPTSYCLHSDHWFLETSINSVKAYGPVVCFVSESAWNGDRGSCERILEVCDRAAVEVVRGDWPDESLHRRAALAEMKRR